MFYIKSVYTGQVYKVSEMPKFGGYVLATADEYYAQDFVKDYEK